MPLTPGLPFRALRTLKTRVETADFLLYRSHIPTLAMATPPDMPMLAAESGPRPLDRFRGVRDPRVVAALFVILMAVQAAGYLVLGTGRAGMGLSESVLVLHNLLALACAGIAFRRAHGAAALFWLLFAVTLLILLIPIVILPITTIFHRAAVSDATSRSLLPVRHSHN